MVVNGDRESWPVRFWHEIELVVVHGAVVVCLELLLLLVAVVTYGLSSLLPAQQETLHRIEALDALFAEFVLWWYGIFMFGRLTVRMLRTLWYDIFPKLSD